MVLSGAWLRSLIAPHMPSAAAADKYAAMDESYGTVHICFSWLLPRPCVLRGHLRSYFPLRTPSGTLYVRRSQGLWCPLEIYSTVHIKLS